MNEPLTVGIITYNEEKRIQRCLESLNFLKKDVTNLHVVVVDNNSCDQTVNISDQVLKNLAVQFTLLKRTENNLAEARNDIIKSAKTRWIYMIDADCRLDADTWPHLINEWSDNPKIAARGGSQKFCPVYEILVLLDEMRRSYFGHFGSAQMRSTGPTEFLEHVSTTHILYDKNALEMVGGFNPLLSSSAEDLDISLRLREKGFQLQFNPQSFLWHEQAHTWGEWAQKAFRNGIWQTRLIAYNMGILKTRRPWPGILLFFLPLVPFKFLLVAGAVYLIGILFLSMIAKVSFVQKLKLFCLFAMTHFLYAVGEMSGVFLAAKDFIRNRKLPISTQA